MTSNSPPRCRPVDGLGAVVTGGSRGIGAAVAKTLAREGASVVISYVKSQERAEEVVHEIRSSGGRAVAVRADVTDSVQVEHLAEAAKDFCESLNILVNNAGRHNERKAFMSLDWRDFEEQINVTLRGTLLCTQSFLPEIAKTGHGRIIMIGTIAIHQPTRGSYAYLAAKGALRALSHTLALETAEQGITVNIVEPALVMTDRADTFSEDFKLRYISQVPVGRIGSPEDVANAVLFLASRGSEYITGSSINVTGGLVMAH